MRTGPTAAGPTAGEVVAHILATVDYFRITVRDRDPGRTWLRSLDLLDDADRLLALARSTMPGRGTDRDDVAMSLLVQGYAFRLASAPIGSWVMHDVVLDPDPASTWVSVGDAHPDGLHLDRARVVSGTDPLTVLHEALVDRHLARLVGAAHAATSVGAAMLWSNIGSACASVIGAFVAPLPNRTHDIADRAEAFFASARPELTTSGTFVRHLDEWRWQRAACCLFHKTESGFRCSDCSLWRAGPADR